MNGFRMRMGTPEDWAKIRNDGKRAFIRRYGLLRFALPVGLLMLIYANLAEPLLFDDPLPSVGSLFRSVLAAIVVWPLAGWLAAEWVWRDREKRFGQDLGEQPS